MKPLQKRLSDPTRPLTRREFLGAAATGAGVILAGCTPGKEAVTARPALDILITGGSIIDGTGSTEWKADVGIRGGRIVDVGNLAGSSAARTIDASGLKVVPGFIDIHSHTDTELFRDPKAESKVHQGVTTEVTGMDGDSAAPLGGPSLERTLRIFKEEFGFECPYRDLDGFLTLLEQGGTAQNILTFVGLGTLREVVIGMDNRPATQEEVREMQTEALRAIDQGAWGASTGLEYTPGSFASAAELSEVISVIPDRQRIYATHMRNEDDRLLDAIREAVAIAADGRARLQISHLKAQYKRNWPKQAEALDVLEQALAAGIDVHADRYPYIAYNTDLAALFPLWAREGGTTRFCERLRDREACARMREEVRGKIEGLGSWDSVLISSVSTERNKPLQGKTMAEIGAERSLEPFDAAVQLLLEEETRVGMVGFGMDEAGTEMVLAWKNTMIASDGGSYSPSRPTSRPHPRCYGTFPRAIAVYQRERGITTLPDMIRKMTSLPAAKLGITDRGVIARGKVADIVLFDYERIQDRATFVDPHQFPDGIPFVLVNGVAVIDGGRQTDLLPGMVLRSQR